MQLCPMYVVSKRMSQEIFLDYVSHAFLLSTVSSPSDYETAPDVIEHLETGPVVPRLE